jgi:adenylate kinase family enzyme
MGEDCRSRGRSNAVSLERPRRILVIGSGGSGKTTLSKEIAVRTGLPVIHLDRLFWRPGWIPTPDAEWDAVIEDLARRDVWIMDGNYGRTLPLRLATADTVLFLDAHPLTSLWRILKRRWKNRGRTRDDVAPGCPEQMNWEFVHWVLTFRTRRRPGILRQLAAARPGQRVVILRNARDVREFLATLA